MGCTVSGGNTGEAERAEVREFPVLEPAVTVQGGPQTSQSVEGDG